MKKLAVSRKPFGGCATGVGAWAWVRTASMRTRFFSRALAIMSRAYSEFDAKGFSHSTWYPASSAFIVHS